MTCATSSPSWSKPANCAASAQPVSPHLEMTALCDRVLRAGGPALLFEQPTGHSMPVLGNLFGTPAPRGARHGRGRPAGPAPVRRSAGHAQGTRSAQGLQGHAGHGRHAQNPVEHGAQRAQLGAACQDVVWEGNDVDLARLPVQHCWPGDVAPLITWGLVITQGPHKARQNLGIYRQQVLSRNQVIMRWLRAPRRRAGFPRARHRASRPAVSRCAWRWAPTRPPFWARSRRCPTACPNTSSPACCAAAAPRWSRRWAATLRVPASAEIVLEGHIHPDASHASGFQHALEGPYGDHTGYYNEQAEFPVFTIDRITMRQRPDLPLHLHRQAARRAGRAGHGAERAVHSAAAAPVPRNHRLLPAARRLQLPHGGGAASRRPTPATRGA